MEVTEAPDWPLTSHCISHFVSMMLIGDPSIDSAALAGWLSGYLSSQLWLYLRQVSEFQTISFIIHNNLDIQNPGNFSHSI